MAATSLLAEPTQLDKADAVRPAAAVREFVAAAAVMLVAAVLAALIVPWMFPEAALEATLLAVAIAA
jgi:hypothetical protein